MTCGQEERQMLSTRISPLSVYRIVLFFRSAFPDVNIAKATLYS